MKYYCKHSNCLCITDEPCPIGIEITGWSFTQNSKEVLPNPFDEEEVAAYVKKGTREFIPSDPHWYILTKEGKTIEIPQPDSLICYK